VSLRQHLGLAAVLATAVLSLTLGLAPAPGAVPLAPARPGTGVPAPVAAGPVVSAEEEHALAPAVAAGAYGATTTTPPVNPPCTTPGTSGNRIAAVYAVFGTTPSRYTTVRPAIIDALKRANGIVYHSARQTGGTRHLRLATDSACQPTVAAYRLPSSAASSFSATVSALRSKGLTSTQRKYVVFADARAMCGLGQTYADDRASSQNANNRGPMFARVDVGCWSGVAVAHEVFHTLGAVQKSAPRSNTALHCRDERDVMCYSGAGGTPVYVSASCSPAMHDERLDCNKNDYFHTRPRAGSYLATHWNTARSSFLWGGGAAYVFVPGPVRSATLTRPTPGSIALRWTAPAVTATAGAPSGYRVYRGRSTSSVALLASTTGLAVTDSRPLTGTSVYVVVGHNAGGNGTKVIFTVTR
jgi:hypothetical protein